MENNPIAQQWTEATTEERVDFLSYLEGMYTSCLQETIQLLKQRREKTRGDEKRLSNK